MKVVLVLMASKIHIQKPNAEESFLKSLNFVVDYMCVLQSNQKRE